MKRYLAVPCALVFALLLSVSALANDWTPINDEVEIDYQAHVVRVFVSAKDYAAAGLNGQKMVLRYIETLTDGQDNKKLADVFKMRKVVLTKVQVILQGNTNQVQYASLPDGTYTSYYTFDLKLLKPLFPELNLPTPGN